MAAHSLARSAASASALGELIPRLARQDAIVFDIAHGGSTKSARTGRDETQTRDVFAPLFLDSPQGALFHRIVPSTRSSSHI
jgi:hypothetical protein